MGVDGGHVHFLAQMRVAAPLHPPGCPSKPRRQLVGWHVVLILFQ